MSSPTPPPSAADYEKLGVFYLGRRWDSAAGGLQPEPLLYEAKDLTTHALCVGMTGSGKTGLCISLLEEAALDGVPAIILDPKGDLGNLLLTFPDLSPSDFAPWVDEDAARRKGMEVEAFAKKTADQWRAGLAEWGQDGDRIRRLRDSVDMAIYTPGSTAGLPLTVLRSFEPPPPALADNRELVNERVEAAASSLLTLVGRNANPLESREHILLANILSRAWDEGRALDLPAIIRSIQSPPFDRLGVFDLESFLPAEERSKLALAINNVLASPGFSSWLEGEPLDIGRLLWTKEGKPRLAILSISHLSETERMFFVTLLLNELLAWVRTQPGTSSLRALLYMDEIFGYFPPSAAPPSKKPMLTLLKQARAYGLGVVLATQNPVDLDYKGLSNTGTWFLGRLQTERDKQRVLDGLEGASTASGAAFDRATIERTLSGLDSRVFLLHNVHEDAPVLFQTRWAMSYLRGPLTRSQISTLTQGQRRAPVNTVAPTSDSGTHGHERPVMPAGIGESFVLPNTAVGDSSGLLYRPNLVANTRLHFVHASTGLDELRDLTVLAPLPADGKIAWSDASTTDRQAIEFGKEVTGANFEVAAAAASSAAFYKKASKELTDHVYQNEVVTIFKSALLKESSRPAETEGEFRGRLAHAARERRDVEVEKLRDRYATKLKTLQDRIRRAEDKVEVQSSQHSQRKLSTVVSIGSTLVGAIFGRKLGSAGSVSSLGTAVKGFGTTAKEKDDVRRAEEELETQRLRLAELETELREKVESLQQEWQTDELVIDTITVKCRKSDIVVTDVGLAWTPWRRTAQGYLEPLSARP